MKKKIMPSEGYWGLIDPIWDSISIDDGPRVFLQHFRKVRPAIGNLFAAHWCQSEVYNGGFEQFFSNSTGVLAPEALVAFRAIGIKPWARALQDAMRLFGEPYPRGRAVRAKRLRRIVGRRPEGPDPFRKLDDRFFAWSHGQYDRWDRVAEEYARKISSS